MARNKSYRHSLLSPAEAVDIGAQLFIEVQELWRARLENQLHPAELCATILLRFAQTWRPQDWRGGGAPEKIELPTDRTLSNELHFLKTNTLRAIPWSCNRALLRWWSGEYPLQLMARIPSPAEVLDLQIEGFRCVTLVQESAQLQSILEGDRDAFSFMIHDLIHADHFFQNKDLRQGQIRFYQKMKVIYSQGQIKDLLQDEQFKKDFEYLISDMNAHPLHLKQTFYAQTLNAFKRRCGVSVEQKLNSLDFARFESSYGSLLSTNDVSI